MRVSEVMTVDVATTTPDTPLRDAARMLAERGISGLPVVDAEGSVIGVVSEADVLAKARRGAENGSGAIARLIHRGPDEAETKHEARFVSEAMTSPAVTTVAFSSVATAAGRMIEHGVNRLPVLDGRGRLVGIVTRADLVRAFARTDDQIAAEAREEIALQQAWAGDDNIVDIAVTDGDVLVTGPVRRRSDAELIPQIIRQVPGVIDVRSELTWSEED